MVGSELVSTGDRIDNDNLKTCFVLGAYNLPGVIWTRELVTDAAHAGEFLMPPTGAGGEDKRQLCDDNDARGDSWLEWDPAQTAGVSTDHAAADEILIIPRWMNHGAILRNIQMVDPGGNVDPMTYLHTNSGAQGSLIVNTEPTLATEVDNLGFNAAAVVGKTGANNTSILTYARTPAIQLYYLADPNDAYTDVVVVI